MWFVSKGKLGRLKAFEGHFIIKLCFACNMGLDVFVFKSGFCWHTLTKFRCRSTSVTKMSCCLHLLSQC